jgi:hypothetical protein
MRHRFWLGLCLALSSAVALHADARSEFLAAAEHQKAQRWAEAAQGYARVTALSPTYAPAWKQLASCRYYLGDLEGAEASAQRYLTLNPNDAAFLAWDGQLRSKLKLAPLDLSTPVPTPIPTALPVDGAITAAPAPSTDAEVIDSSASTPELQAQLVEDSPAAAAKAVTTWGLRLAGSISLGLGKFEHGEQVTSSTTPSNKTYPGQAGMGLGGLAELLYAWNPKWELSLGLYPVAWQETQSSAQTSTVTRSNESTASGLLLPVLINGGARFPLSPTITALLSAGLGVIPSAHVEVEDSTVQTATSSLVHTKLKGAIDYGLAPAWRLAAGMEVPLNKIAAIYVGGQLLGAQFSATAGNYSYQDFDQSGNLLGSGTGTSKPIDLSVLSASALVGLSARF